MANVGRGLKSGRFNIVKASSMYVLAMDWSRLQYMLVQSPSMTVTAWVLRKEALSRLTPQDQKTVLELARLAARAYSDKEVQFAADAARQLFGRGVQPIDLSPYDQEWEQLYCKTQQVFVGDAYSAETLRVAEKAAAGTSP